MKLFYNNLITTPATEYLLRKMYYTIYCIIYYTIQEPKHYIIIINESCYKLEFGGLAA